MTFSAAALRRSTCAGAGARCLTAMVCFAAVNRDRRVSPLGREAPITLRDRRDGKRPAELSDPAAAVGERFWPAMNRPSSECPGPSTLRSFARAGDRVGNEPGVLPDAGQERRLALVQPRHAEKVETLHRRHTARVDWRAGRVQYGQLHP
jgi:hypothetical protein